MPAFLRSWLQSQQAIAAPWHHDVSVWWPGWECSKKKHLLDAYLEMELCPLNSMELLSGCCSHWSTARNPDCSSGCPTAALGTERAPAPRRPPFPHPAVYTQERDSLCLQESVTFTHFQLSLLPSRACHHHNPTGLGPAIYLGLGTDASLESLAL